MASTSAERQQIAAEQTYVDGVYDRLEASARTAQSLVAEGYARGHIGHEGGLVERDAMVYQASRRLSALHAAYDGLVFGRLDLLDGQTRYVGRIGVRDADREILLVDWRAPAAGVFYQATAQDPRGVVRRRVLRCTGSRVVGVEDDLLDADAAPDDLVVIGEGALLAELSRARDSAMHSVVATIQKEQDEAIRAPVRGATVIGGGPGTGKTVVALHRAAYLLYSDRRRFESGGVLVVGPSRVFMAYIDRVLPSLGETSVTLRSLGGVVDGLTATEHDEPVAAAAKGSSAWTAVLRRLVASAQPGEPTELRYFYLDDVLRLDADRLAGIRRQLLRGTRRNRAYRAAPAALADALWAQVGSDRGVERGRSAFLDAVTTDRRFVDFVEAWWPEVDAVELWRTLPGRLREVAGDDFTDDELTALEASWGGGAPTIEDVPLIDELRYLIGEIPPETEHDDLPRQLMSFERRELDEREERTRSTGSIEDETVAHLLVDEAQDLSPMQWRMLGRRGGRASWTIVGDPAQSSWPYPEEAARARREALSGLPEHVFRLTTNYRNSAEIYDLAAQVAVSRVPDADRPEAVRRTGVQPRHELVRPRQLPNAVRTALRALLDDVEGTVAVVVPRALTGSYADLAEVDPDRIRVLDALATKGLEFDGVVVVEPDALVAESAAGWRTLYVVLTRATHRLTTLGCTAEWRDVARLGPDPRRT